MNEKKNRVPIFPERIVDPRSQPLTTPRWRGNLPHLYKEGCTYFVTFCLSDTVPRELRRKRTVEADGDPSLIAAELDPSPTSGSCLLRESKVALIVENSLLHFQGERYELSAWCVMPNHVHVVVTPYSGFTLPAILHSWKSYTAHEINGVLSKVGKIWEEESFDHLIRNEKAFGRFVDYVQNNPVAAGLCSNPEDWPFSSARFCQRHE
jgi:REP element-mobilizing transposase RayT